MKYQATTATRPMLEGLAYWIADAAYIRERYGENCPELITCRKTIENMFPRLDAAGVPYWVQNTVIAWAEDWRRYKGEYMWPALSDKGIERGCNA